MSATTFPINLDKPDHFVCHQGQVYAGQHLILDLWGVAELDDIELMEKTFKLAVEKSGATLLHIHMHHFSPYGGISGVAVLAESHISVHTWPEIGYAAFDVFMCGDAKPEVAIEIIKQQLRPEKAELRSFKRGEIPELDK